MEDWENTISSLYFKLVLHTAKLGKYQALPKIKFTDSTKSILYFHLNIEAIWHTNISTLQSDKSRFVDMNSTTLFEILSPWWPPWAWEKKKEKKKSHGTRSVSREFALVKQCSSRGPIFWAWDPSGESWQWSCGESRKIIPGMHEGVVGKS